DAMAAAIKSFEPMLPADPRDKNSKPSDPAAAQRVKDELDRATQRAEPPPSPRASDGSPYFPVKLAGEETNHTYSWVEMGKSYLWSRGVNLNSESLERSGNKKTVEEHEESGQPFKMSIDGNPENQCLIYVRKIPPGEWARRNPKDRQQGKTR